MKRKIFRRLLIGFLIFIAVWLVFAQFIMKSRISDNKAKQKFSKAGVALTIDTINIDGFKIHYAKTGDDTLPTCNFTINGPPYE